MSLVKNLNTLNNDAIKVGEEKSVALGIDLNDPTALAPLLDGLTDQYGDPVNDLTREVLSNAQDATTLVRKDKQRPIEITSPSVSSPYFIVRDYGVGMTPEIVEKNYTSFLASTKIMDLTLIGSHGQGAKAPLTYCSEYTVETARDGIFTVFTISRTDKGYKYKFVSIEENTDKPNGTKVIIPVKPSDFNNFQEALTSYKSYSFDIPLIIDGVLYEVNDDYVHLTNVALDDNGTEGRVFVKKDSLQLFFKSSVFSYQESFVSKYVLGGWMYDDPHSKDKFRYLNNDGSPNVIVELVPGVLDFTKSRSDIIKNERSFKLHERIMDIFSDPETSESILKIYRNFSNIEALEFTQNLSYSAYSREAVPSADVFFQNKSFSLSDFDTSTGFNPFTLRYTDYPIDAYSILRYSSPSNVSLIRKFDGQSGQRYLGQFVNVFPSFSYSGHIKKVNEEVVQSVVSDKPLSSFGDFLAGLTKIYTLDSNKDSVLVVTNVNDKNIAKLTAARMVIINNFSYEYIVYAHDVDSISELSDKFEVFNVKYIDADELLQQVAEIRKKNRKVRASAPEIKYNFEYLGRFDDVVQKLKSTEDNTMIGTSMIGTSMIGTIIDPGSYIELPVSKIDEDSILIIEDGKLFTHGVIKGLYNQDYKLNPKVYLIDNRYLKARDYQRFLKIDNVYFTESVDNIIRKNSISGQNLSEKSIKVFDKYFKEEFNDLSEIDFLSAFLYPGPGNENYRIFLKEYANFLISRQEYIDEAFSIMTAVDTTPSAVAIDSLRETRFNETVENSKFFISIKEKMNSIIDRSSFRQYYNKAIDYEADLIASTILTAKKNVDQRLVYMILELFHEKVESDL